MRKSIIRQLRSELGRAKQRLRMQDVRKRSGVRVAQSDEEFQRLRETMKPAKPGEVGVLLVRRPLSQSEWEEKYSPGPPVHEEAT